MVKFKSLKSFNLRHINLSLCMPFSLQIFSRIPLGQVLMLGHVQLIYLYYKTSNQLYGLSISYTGCSKTLPKNFAGWLGRCTEVAEKYTRWSASLLKGKTREPRGARTPL